ncbi:MAG: hypothetical protein FWD91_04455 [Treponema sp.]|nr:hypothetical protein [Treponema sp.]
MKFLVFVMFFIAIHASLFSVGRKEQADNLQIVESERGGAERGGAVQVVGRVQIYGSEPHTFVGIVDTDSNEYAIYPATQEEALRKLQGHLLAFTVIFMDEPRGYGATFLNGGTVTVLTWEIIR